MTTKTFRLGKADIERKWQVLDAGGRPVGRIASEAASLLLGKHKPTYEPHLTMGDYVIVVNAGQVMLTGRKAEQKIYYRHSGYPGGLLFAACFRRTLAGVSCSGASGCTPAPTTLTRRR